MTRRSGRDTAPEARARASCAPGADLQRSDHTASDAEVLRRLGVRIRELRIGHGFGTRALASRAALARSTLQRLERGVLRPRLSLLSAVALGLDPDRQAEIRDDLVGLTGAALAPDTDGTRSQRRRRLERGILAGTVPLPAKLDRALRLHRQADELWAREEQLLSQPGAMDDSDVLDEVLAMSDRRRQLREEAGPSVSFYVGRHRITAGWLP